MVSPSLRLAHSISPRQRSATLQSSDHLGPNDRSVREHRRSDEHVSTGYQKPIRTATRDIADLGSGELRAADFSTAPAAVPAEPGSWIDQALPEARMAGVVCLSSLCAPRRREPILT